MFGRAIVNQISYLNLTKRSLPRLVMQYSTETVKQEKEDKFQELKKMKARPLYLDAQATQPVDPRVLDAMMPYMTNLYGNPHSRTHAYGWESEQGVEKAREVIYS